MEKLLSLPVHCMGENLLVETTGGTCEASWNFVASQVAVLTQTYG